MIYSDSRPKSPLLKLIPILLLLAPGALYSQDDQALIEWIDGVLEGPERQLANYGFDPASSVISRVKTPNRHFLAYIQTVEPQAKPAQVPSDEELELIEGAINLLPPLLGQIARESVIEITFVENLGSSGWTDWVVDDQGDLYCVVAIDRQVLSMGLGKWLELRENTCFNEDSTGITIEIDTGTKYTGFLGILLHELTHAADCILNITPFVEPSIYALNVKQQKGLRASYPYIEDVWEDMYTPVSSYDFALRDSLTFYRSAGSRKLAAADAVLVFEQLEATPFVSLFGSRNWAEDLAEMVMFYHLTQVLDQPYTITITEKRKQISIHQPMQHEAARARFAHMQMFYAREQ
ncbi:MAG: hypothetical protein V3W14_10145 [Candidatus Neomarinimicrobiota bacterium]